MIKISSWCSYQASELESINSPNEYILTFTYSDQYDDRSGWCSRYIEKVSEKSTTVDYNPIDTSLKIGGKAHSLLELNSYDLPDGKILVDSTSLALPELLHLFSIMEKNKRSFDVMYVQPNDYTESKSKGLRATQSFDLSDDGTGVQQIPPYVGYSSGSMIFFFLGWEGHRLGSLINSEEFDTSNITCLLGIPPFKTSWDYKTLSSNYKHIADLNNVTTPRFKYAAANDPIKTYELIEQVYQSTTYHDQSLSLAPFGTKPAAIASAQFAVNNKSRLIMLYDFVKKKQKRSKGTDLVHVWNFDYSE